MIFLVWVRFPIFKLSRLLQLHQSGRFGGSWCTLSSQPLQKAISDLALTPGLLSLQALSNTTWAFSRLDETNEELLKAVAGQSAKQMRHFNAQNVANTVSFHL